MFKYANKEQLTAKQTAKYTGYSLGTIYNYTSNGEIPYSNPTGGKLLFNKAEIDKWLEQKRGESEEMDNQVTELENSLLDSKELGTQRNIIDVLNDIQEEEDRQYDGFYIGMIDTVYFTCSTFPTSSYVFSYRDLFRYFTNFLSLDIHFIRKDIWQ
jgi:excisionase family DNA binding protein